MQNVPMSQVTSVIFLINLFLCEVKNVSVDFNVAHGYQQREAIELQMARNSWFVILERTCTNNKVCMSFKYEWDEFCASNHLSVGDICFFSVICEANYSDDDDEE